jgi:hypothetical protein
MGSPLVFLALSSALATLQRQHCVPHSIHPVYCDRARDGRPHLAQRPQQPALAPRMPAGFPHGESKHGVRKSSSPACPALPEHCRSARIFCNRIPVLERPGSTRGSCSFHWASANAIVIVRFLYCPHVVLILLLLLDGAWEPPSAATEQATNGWRLQHIIYTVVNGIACAVGERGREDFAMDGTTGIRYARWDANNRPGSRGFVNGHANGRRVGHLRRKKDNHSGRSGGHGTAPRMGG